MTVIVRGYDAQGNEIWASPIKRATKAPGEEMYNIYLESGMVTDYEHSLDRYYPGWREHLEVKR